MPLATIGAHNNGRFGGPFSFDFEGMFAPVVTRFVTYGVAVPPFAATYIEAVLHRGDIVEWIELAQEEPWVIEQYEGPAA